MKKTLTFILALTLLVSLVTVSASAEVTTVKFWTHLNEAWNNSYIELIEEFEAANPDIKIEYTQFPYNDFESKIQTSLIAGEEGADIYEVWGGWILDFASNGVLSEMPDAFWLDLQNDAYEPVMGTLQYNGKVYGAPLEFNVGYGGILANKQLFEDAGLAYPTTWEEVMNIARSVAVQNGASMDMRGLEFANNDSLTFNWLAMILQNGGTFTDENGKLDFTSDAAVKSMETMVSYIKDDHVTNTDTTTGSQGISDQAMVALGEAFMCINGPWIISEAEGVYDAALGEVVDYISQPAFVEGATQDWVAETGWSLVVAKATKVEEAAWRFVSFLLEPENLIRHNIDCAQIPPRKSVMENPTYVESVPYMGAIIDIMPYAHYIGRFNTDVLKAYVNAMFVSLCDDDGTYATVAEACQKLTKDLNDTLKYY